MSIYINQNHKKIVFSEFVCLIISFVISLFEKKYYIGVLMMISLLGLTLLLLFIQICLKLLFTKNEIVIILKYTLLTSIICGIMYIVIIYSRDYIYLADYACYYNLQQEYYELFNNHVLKGLLGTLQSFWMSDYSYFICIFTSLPFYFTTHSPDAFLLTYYVFLVIPVILAVNMLLITLFNKVAVSHVELEYRKVYLIVGNIIFITFPLLQCDSILGMPDIFGLVFYLIASSIICRYNIRTINWSYNIVLLISTLCGILTRRWYIFGFIGIYIGYAVAMLIINYSDFKVIVINGIKSMLFIGGVSVILMLPFIYDTIKSDYSNSYNAWSYGGFFWEVYNQCRFLGGGIVIILLVGAIGGIVQKELRTYSLCLIISFLVSVYSFTRIQNMMSHHALCLMAVYLSLVYIAVLLAITTRKKYRILLNVIISIIFICNMYYSLSGKVIRDGTAHMLTNINLDIDNRESGKNVWEY